MATGDYRQTLDIEYTLAAYHKAKEDEARDLAKRIRWANPTLTADFDLIDKQHGLIPVDRPEGWDT